MDLTVSKEKLAHIQSNLKINHGTFIEEYQEQLLSVKYLTGNEQVLELGGNIGRNALIIATILNNNNNNKFVTLETNSQFCSQLMENKLTNNLDFNIVNSALSNRKLIQKKNQGPSGDWLSIPSDILYPGYEYVNIVSFTELENTYDVTFDTLIVDCEGAFLYILQDFPDMLKDIKLIIIENDYQPSKNYSAISKKKWVDNKLIENNFKIDFTHKAPHEPDIGMIMQKAGQLCYDNFYEVWKKK